MRSALRFGTALLTALGLWMLAAPVSAPAADSVELKFAHFMPPVHVQHTKSFVPFADKVGQLSGGQVTVKVFPGGTLGGPKQLLDAVKAGITDIAFIIPAYLTGRFPRTSVFDLPFLCDTGVQATKALYSVFDEYLASEFDDVKVLWLYSSDPGQFHTTTHPVKTLGDFQGFKARTPSAMMSEALKLLGANPVGMPISELAVSLQKGVIDAVVTPYSAIPDFKLFDLIKSITEVNLYVTPMAVVMNKAKFESLPPEGKKAIEEAGGMAMGLHAAGLYDAIAQDTVKKIQSEGKINLVRLSSGELAAIQQRVAPLEQDWVQAMSAKGIPAEKLLAAVKKAVAENR